MHGVASFVLTLLALPPLGVPLIGCLALVPWLACLRHGVLRSIPSSLLFGAGVGVWAWWGGVQDHGGAIAAVAAIYGGAAVLIGGALACSWSRLRTPEVAAVAGVLAAAVGVFLEWTGVPSGLALLVADGNSALSWAALIGGSGVGGLLVAGQAAVTHAALPSDTAQFSSRRIVTALGAGAVYAVALGAGPLVAGAAPTARLPEREAVLVQSRVPPAMIRFASADGVLEEIERYHAAMLARLRRLDPSESALVLWPADIVPGYGPTVDGGVWRRITGFDAPMLLHAYRFGAGMGRVSGTHALPAGRDRAATHVPRRIWPPLAAPDTPAPEASGARLHAVVGLRVAGLIGYETALSHPARRAVRDGAQWIYNPVGDGFIGPSVLAELHAALARLRAVEVGRPVVRVGNGGPSAIYDARGRRIAAMPRFARGVERFPVPPVIRHTPFGKYGHWFEWTFVLAVVPAGFVVLRRSARGRRGRAGERLGRRSRALVACVTLSLFAAVLVQTLGLQREYATRLLQRGGAGRSSLELTHADLKRDRRPESAALALLLREFGVSIRYRDVPSTASARANLLVRHGLALRPGGREPEPPWPNGYGLIDYPGQDTRLLRIEGERAVLFSPRGGGFHAITPALQYWLRNHDVDWVVPVDG